MTKIIELILTESRRGTGKENDPIRNCPQLFTKDGKLVAMADPEKGEQMFIHENIGKL